MTEWDRFRTRMKGKGHSQQQLSEMYAASRPKSRSRSRSRVRMSTFSPGMSKANPSPPGRTLAHLPKTRRARSKSLERQMEKSKEKRGSRTRGWAASSPQRGRERRELYNKCGSQCFLEPKSLGFPVCAALRENEGCRVDCRGVTSARVRAAQWKHKGALRKSIFLEKRYKC